MQALLVYNLYAAQPEKVKADISRQPQIDREVAYYKENIDKIDSAEALIKDTRLYNFTMRAYGLEDISYAKALVKKVLEGGIDDRDALANRMADPRYMELAGDFNFKRHGENTTLFEKVKTGVVDKYIQQSIELDAGKQNDGARLAMYFDRKADEINSFTDILADKALLAFVKTALQLPEQISLSPLEKQVEMISNKMNIEDLSDPEKMKKLVDRFLVLWDQSNPQQISVPPLVSAPSGPQAISLDILSSLQSLKSF